MHNNRFLEASDGVVVPVAIFLCSPQVYRKFYLRATLHVILSRPLVISSLLVACGRSPEDTYFTAANKCSYFWPAIEEGLILLIESNGRRPRICLT